MTATKTSYQLVIDEGITNDGYSGAFSSKEATSAFFGAARSSGLMVGLLIGLLIQTSALAGNYILVVLHNQNRRSRLSDGEYYFVTLVWALVTSLLGIACLLQHRGNMLTMVCAILKEVVLTSSDKKNNAKYDLEENVEIDGYCVPEADDKDMERFAESILKTVDTFFAIGAMMGTSVAWTVTDCLLGMTVQAYQGLAVSALSILWYLVVIVHGGRHRKEVSYKYDNEEGRPEALVVVVP